MASVSVQNSSMREEPGVSACLHRTEATVAPVSSVMYHETSDDNDHPPYDAGNTRGQRGGLGQRLGDTSADVPHGAVLKARTYRVSHVKVHASHTSGKAKLGYATTSGR